MNLYALLSAACLLVASCSDDFSLPPHVADSKFIHYYTDVDASVVCLDDLLAREDKFIERTASLLGVEPPNEPIDFVWDPVMDKSGSWECPELDTLACYRSRSGDELSLVVSSVLPQHHELVHAIEIQALGQGGHPVLVEGVAEYLGSLNVALPRPDFSDEFKTLLELGSDPIDYRLAMQFVGTIFAEHGAAKYRELREKMPTEARLEKFAEVFEVVYGKTLEETLDEMNNQGFTASAPFPGCDADVRMLAWTEDQLIETTIESACGDPWFFGGGFVEGFPGFLGYYGIDVIEPGMYELTVRGVADGLDPRLSGVTACSFEDSRVASRDGKPGQGVLLSGKHTLVIQYPQQTEARGEMSVRLEYLGPPP